MFLIHISADAAVVPTELAVPPNRGSPGLFGPRSPSSSPPYRSEAWGSSSFEADWGSLPEGWSERDWGGDDHAWSGSGGLGDSDGLTEGQGTSWGEGDWHYIYFFMLTSLTTFSKIMQRRLFYLVQDLRVIRTRVSLDPIPGDGGGRLIGNVSCR